MEQADGGGSGVVHRLEERRHDEWRRGGAALQERSHDYIRALQSADPKTLYARKAAKAPTVKRFCGVRGGNCTPWRCLGAFGDTIPISGVARATP
jgi:hypothetical protein